VAPERASATRRPTIKRFLAAGKRPGKTLASAMRVSSQLGPNEPAALGKTVENKLHFVHSKMHFQKPIVAYPKREYFLNMLFPNMFQFTRQHWNHNSFCSFGIVYCNSQLRFFDLRLN
jgi:hypothetical protein